MVEEEDICIYREFKNNNQFETRSLRGKITEDKDYVYIERMNGSLIKISKGVVDKIEYRNQKNRRD